MSVSSFGLSGKQMGHNRFRMQLSFVCMSSIFLRCDFLHAVIPQKNTRKGNRQCDGFEEVSNAKVSCFIVYIIYSDY